MGEASPDNGGCDHPRQRYGSLVGLPVTRVEWKDLDYAGASVSVRAFAALFADRS